MVIRKAVLLIHGLASGPYDMESIAWKLARNLTLDVYQFTLPGHGKKCRFKYTDWVKSAEEKVETLIKYGYSDIYVVGHSMGGILACYVATKYPEIKKVVLAAPAFKYIAEKDNFSIKKTVDIIDEYGFRELIFRGFKRTNISSLNKFKKLAKDYQEVPKKVNVPILIFQGLKDDVVPLKSSKYVLASVKSKQKNLICLKKSNHLPFDGPQAEIINSMIEEFLIHNKVPKEEEIIE